MHFNLESHTIYYARHGSHAYGLNVETSDEDFKGICIPPLEFELGFLHNFEQVEEMVSKGQHISYRDGRFLVVGHRAKDHKCMDVTTPSLAAGLRMFVEEMSK